jgi:hypothetical protein
MQNNCQINQVSICIVRQNYRKISIIFVTRIFRNSRPFPRESDASEAKSVKHRLVEIDPISGKESEQYPDAYPKEYRKRVEKFSKNYIWRRITGDITIEFLEAAVERMFNADEVAGVVDPAKLKELKHGIVHLFLYARDTGRNHWN